MAEIIGVVSAAAQLMATCVDLIDFMKKIKGGSSALRRYYEQLQELHSLSDNISRNPLLQTAEVGNRTRTLLSILSNNNLAPLLQKGRFRQTLHFIYHDRAISTLFNDLEKQKATLSLIINDIQSRALYQIQTDIKTMAEHNNTDQTTIKESSPADRDALEETSPTVQRSPNTGSQGSPNTNALVPQGIPLSSQDDSLLVQHFSMLVPSKNPPPRAQDDGANSDFEDLEKFLEFAKKHRKENPDTGAIYHRCEAGDGVNQINGAWIGGANGLAEAYVKATPKARPLFNCCTKSGRGEQVNGVLVEETFEGLETFTPAGTYVRCELLPGETKDGDAAPRVGTQTLGVRLRPLGSRVSSKMCETQHNGRPSGESEDETEE